MPKLTEKQLAKEVSAAGFALWPRYDDAGRKVYAVCARDGAGNPDFARVARSGMSGHGVRDFLAGVEYGQHWEEENGDA